jgi:hypothetical protein
MKAFGRRVDAHLKLRKDALRLEGSAKHPMSATRKEKMKERTRRRKEKKRGEDGLTEEVAADSGESGDGPARSTIAISPSGGELDNGGKKRQREAASDDVSGGGLISSGTTEPAARARKHLRTDEFPTDRVAFGDRAMAPPTLAVIPRTKVCSGGARVCLVCVCCHATAYLF